MPEPSLESMVKGQRVGLHPATDLWMRGVKYGTVVGTAVINGQDMLMVTLDGGWAKQVNNGRPLALAWEDVLFMADLGQA